MGHPRVARADRRGDRAGDRHRRTPVDGADAVRTGEPLRLGGVHVDDLELAEHLRQATAGSGGDAGLACDRFAVAVGKDILGVIPGRISTEVDARLSFDARATIERARALIALYEAAGVPRDKVLIKIAATWAGVEATRVLQHETGNGVVQIPLPPGLFVVAFENLTGQRRYGVVMMEEVQ